MLTLKSPLLFGIFFLLVSLSATLFAMPKPGELEEKRNADRLTSEYQEAQEWRASENGGISSSEQRGSVAHIKDWDDLLNEQTSQQSGEAPKKERDDILEQLGQAAQQAYARADENHPDWKEVAGLIEGLRPENVVSRRLSNAGEAAPAEAESLEYNFFCATLPAIKKTSVVAALRAPNNFQTAAIMEKANEEKGAWEEARIKFDEVCKEQKLHNEYDVHINYPAHDSKDADFDSEGPFEAYFYRLNYKIDRFEIEKKLDALHQEIMKGIIDTNVTTKDFETRVFFSATNIEKGYQPLLVAIAEAKNKADPLVQYKWEQFQQEAAAHCLEDLSQVAKIKLWQNRNQLASINKFAERAHDQAERAFSVVAWEQALSAGKAAQDAWTARNGELQQSQKNLNEQKTSLVLKISTAIEQEIRAELAAAGKAMQYWIERQAQITSKNS